MTFIQGRQIIYAALIFNVCGFHSESMEPGLLCKLDIQKAFDHVNWDFLSNILRDVGFGIKWISWIKFCISNFSFSILVSQCPEVFIPSHSGLRQGDPLSPFLFISATEDLNDMMEGAAIDGWFRGFVVKNKQNENLVITQLLYADDTQVICEATHSFVPQPF